MNGSMLDEIRQRTYRYYYEDGLVEIAVGGFLIVTGLSLGLLERAQIDGRFACIFGLSLLVMAVVGAYAVKTAIMALKERISFPRSGQVRYGEQPSSGRWLLAVAVALVVLINFFLPDSTAQMTLMVAGLMAAILVFMGMRVGLRRMQLAAIFPVAAGIFSSFFTLGEITVLDEVTGIAMVFAISGLAILISGTLALLTYMRKNPVGGKDDAK